jgi:hypothetical protein
MCNVECCNVESAQEEILGRNASIADKQQQPSIQEILILNSPDPGRSYPAILNDYNQDPEPER